MPHGRYRTRSRSPSPRKKIYRRRHRSSKSSGSDYSRSRSRSVEKRYDQKDRPSRRTPPKYRSSKQSSSRDRGRLSYNERSHRKSRSRSRSSSSSPRRRRSAEKKEQSSNYVLDTVKVLSGNFSEIPGLDVIGRVNEKVKKERSFSPVQGQKSSQDLDMRLREFEVQQSTGASRSRQVNNQGKNAQRQYYNSRSMTQQGYQQRDKSPGKQKYESTSYTKDRPMTADDERYREQRSDYGIRVEVKRKPSPKRRKFDSHLVVVPRRKDEGLRSIFDRQEIIVRTLEDDPELYPEKYERFASWRKSPEDDRRNRVNVGGYGKERDERQRKQSSHHKEKMRSLSPHQPREATVVMKPFTVFEKFEQSLRNRSSLNEDDHQYLLQRAHDFNQSQQSLLSQRSPTSYSIGLDLDNVINAGSDLRHDLEVRRHILALEEDKQLGMHQAQFSSGTPPMGRLSSSGFSLDRREVSSDRRPVRERLGGVDGGRLSDGDSKPDFRKEVEEIQRLDPSTEPYRGTFFQHDDRARQSPPMEKRGRPPFRGHFISRPPFRGMRGSRGFFRGYAPRGRGFPRVFRGSYYRGMGRGTYRPYSSTWKHDKFEDKELEKKKEKKEKKPKTSDKKRDSKQK